VGRKAGAALRSVRLRGEADLNIVGLLLAAGSASRFGSDKLRHALPHGVPIAVQSARHLKLELPRVVAVVRPASAELGQALREALGDKRGISRFGDATVPLESVC